MPEGYEGVPDGGIQRTEIHCHNCSKGFVAALDMDINGNHVIECPHCGHEHCRKIKDGKITGDRWDGRNCDDDVVIKARSVWKSSVIQAETSTVAHHIRERWLNKEY